MPYQQQHQQSQQKRVLRRDQSDLRTYVHPSEMTAGELKALVCLFLHKGTVYYTTGHAFTHGVHHPSIDPHDTIIAWPALNRLRELRLLTIETNKVTMVDEVRLTGAGRGIAKGLQDRPIIGYD